MANLLKPRPGFVVVEMNVPLGSPLCNHTFVSAQVNWGTVVAVGQKIPEIPVGVTVLIPVSEKIGFFLDSKLHRFVKVDDILGTV